MNPLRRPLVIIAAITIATVLPACDEEKHSYVANMGNPQVTPTMVTTDVATLISDSGYIRYDIETPLWRMFEDIPEPRWTFPDGLALQQYDDNMATQARMRCDSATYFVNKRLWRLDGHVVMINVMRDTFLTSQMYWDQTRQKVYSDSFMHVTRATYIVEGYGFTSNQTMTEYTVQRPTAIIPVDRSKMGQGGEGGGASASADSLQPRQRGLHSIPPPPASQRYQNIHGLSNIQ